MPTTAAIVNPNFGRMKTSARFFLPLPCWGRKPKRAAFRGHARAALAGAVTFAFCLLSFACCLPQNSLRLIFGGVFPGQR